MLIMREQRIHLRVSQDEYDLIRQKMAQTGCFNMSAYLRKMAIDGLIVKLDMPEKKEILRLLRYNGNNINQIAKRLNADEGIYVSDITDIKDKQAEILKLIREAVEAVKRCNESMRSLFNTPQSIRFDKDVQV